MHLRGLAPESSDLNNACKSPAARLQRVLGCALLALVSFALTSCGVRYYKVPEFTFANRPVPPSRLLNRVMVSITNGGSTGSLQVLDGLRDIRNTIQNPNSTFPIGGYSGAFPSLILNFPEQSRGYVYSDVEGSLQIINYGTEAATGPATTSALPARSSSIAVSNNLANIYSAEETTGQLVVVDGATNYALNLPGVYRVAVNAGNSVILAMVRNSDTLYRVIRLNATQPAPPGNVDCQPYNIPVFCVVPVPGTFDRPIGAYFSIDGTNAYVLNCGRECGGTASSVSVLPQSALNYKLIPTSTPYPVPAVATVPVPGGVTVAVSDGATLFLAGQQLQPDGLFAGYLSTLDLAGNTVTGTYRISDGNHTRLLFADDNTLWVGSQSCALGEHAKLGENYNCLTRFDLGAKTAQIIPAVTPGGSTTVPFPNENLNPYYYGDLTGLCWVQNLHKVYTAYGGQVHAFHTADGSELDNKQLTVQGTALDVAYIDALTNAAN